jgi:MFS transporter, Spinster family, sphingosine-1-phosphate transporter
MLTKTNDQGEPRDDACAAYGQHRYYKWELLGLLFLAYFFHQGDRAIFGVVLSSIRGELHLSDEQLGMVGSVLFLTLALMMPIAGYLGDIWSRKWIITCSLVFWSAATMFTGLVNGLLGLVAFRSVATAGGESFYAPAACSLLAAAHKRTRALALSVHQASLYLGVTVSGFLGGWIALRYGWRSAFYVFGGFGILLGGVFAWRLKDAPREPASAQHPSAKVGPIEALGVLFRTPTALLATAGFTAIVFVNNAYLVWAPNFLGTKFELDLPDAGLYSMLFHHVAAMIGVLAGGRLSDVMVVRRPQFRLQLQTSSMLLAAPMIVGVGLGESLAVTCAAMAGMGLFRGLCESNTQATLFDVVPPRYRASAVSMMVMVGFLVGSSSSWLLGCCPKLFGPEHGLSYGFAAFSLVYLAGGLAFLMALLFTFHRDRCAEA